MAGHSKFKNIMYRKGAQDKKRSAMFSKLSREITVAAKMGTPDPDMNPRLRAAVLAAKAQSMPKDNIQRSIDKASKGDATRAETLVADLLVILGFIARRLVDRPLDIVLGHRLRARCDHRRAQPRVCLGVGQAHLRRDGDFTAQLGEHRRALFVLRALAMHDVLELGMASHVRP